MNRIVIALAVLLGIAATASVAHAGFEAGDKTLSLSGAGTNDKDFNDGSFSLTLTPGYFISNEVEIGVRQTLTYADGFNGATFGFVDYNFNNVGDGKLVPYVGIAAGASYGEDVDTDWSAGPEIGARYFVNSTTFINVNATYQFDLQDGIEDGAFFYGVGIGFRF